MNELVLSTIERGVAVVRMNAPERLNALSLDMRDALIDTLQRWLSDSNCQAIVLTGMGGNFSSGGDIKSVRPEPEDVAATMRYKVGRLHALVRVICNSAKPIIAAVDGKAFGAGLSVAAACDLIVASERSSFCAVFGKIGLVADAGLLYTLPRRVGPGKGRLMLLTASVVAAPEALAIGLADTVVPHGTLLEIALEEAQKFTHIAPLAFAATKSLLNGAGTLEDAFAEELRIQPLLAMSTDYAEARAAFAEKRKPIFRGC